MSDPFHASKRGIARAKHHFSDLERQVVAFLKDEDDPYRGVTEIDPNTGDEVHKFKLTRPLPAEWPDVIFDIVSSLRSALDRAGYTVAVAAGKSGKNAKFPFGDDVVQLENNIKRGGCKDLPDEILDLMRSFKPYKGGNDALWALNKLCNTNKHAFITTIITSGISYRSDGKLDFTKAGGRRFMFASFPEWDREKNEVELFRCPPGTATEMKFRISGYIGFGEIESLEGKHIGATLDEFIRIVEGIVMAIEAEARRIGLV